ncbi:hypothetical protein AACH06_28940 [Ideonella sp. DXS29W]|uniref:Uncharacterized protein n=1 Tax=Ideonella lacteola TaxID=2984193 RepID=A0ABU9BYM1_9BURK
MEQPSSFFMRLAHSQWSVPLLFVTIWLVGSAVMARAGGWRSLGQRFSTAAKPEGQSFRFVSGSSGLVHLPIRYRNCLHIVIGGNGLYAAVMFPFNFQCPALLVPWSAIESIIEKQGFFNRTVTFHISGLWPVITLSGSIGQLAKAAYEQSRGPQ